ncbi:MAG: zinc-ribbon domain-containing protein [Clostridia bacterium]|nr:zinc-ribbon domain-containing protein [Clostridia bacterium]
MKIDFSKIKKGFSVAAQKTKETSESVIEIAKLKYKLVEINSEIEENFKKIGKLVYNAAEDEDITDGIKELCDTITALTEKRDDMQENFNELVNKKQCPKCGMKLDKDFEFCPKCGHNFEE